MGGTEAPVNGDATFMAFLCSYVLIARNSNFIKIFLALKLPINLSDNSTRRYNTHRAL